MLTVRDFLAYRERCSPDGRYWEPALPVPPSLIGRVRDAWCVLTGRAVAMVRGVCAGTPGAGTPTTPQRRAWATMTTGGAGALGLSPRRHDQDADPVGRRDVLDVK
jgi:hypothetical protein